MVFFFLDTIAQTTYPIFWNCPSKLSQTYLIFCTFMHLTCKRKVLRNLQFEDEWIHKVQRLKKHLWKKQWESPNILKILFFPSISYQRIQWHPTPVLLPGKSHGRRSLVAAVHGVAKSRAWLKWLSSSSSISYPWLLQKWHSLFEVFIQSMCTMDLLYK